MTDLAEEGFVAAVHFVDELASSYASGDAPGDRVSADEALVVDVVRRVWDASRTRWLLGAELGSAPRLVERAEVVCRKLALQPDEERFVVTLDGTTTAETLVASGTLDPAHAAQLLCALALLGLMTFERRGSDPAPARRGLSTFPPPAFPALHAAEEQPDPEAAAALFDAGSAALRAGQLGKAVRDLDRAHRLAPKSHVYDLYAAWARFCLRDNPDHIRAAIPGLEERVMRVIREDKRVAFAHYVHGRLQLLKGDNDGALRALHVAVRLDPHDLEARMYCRVLERRAVGRHPR